MSEDVKHTVQNMVNWVAKIVFALLAFFSVQMFYSVQKIADGVVQLNIRMTELHGEVQENKRDIERLERSKSDKK